MLRPATVALATPAIIALAFVVLMWSNAGPNTFRLSEQRAEAAFLAEVKKLTASDAYPRDRFGGSVVVSGDTAFVGAAFEVPEGYTSGSVYLFERNEGGVGNWGEVKKFTSSDAFAGDEFGGSMALIADTLVVGAPGEDGEGGIGEIHDNFGAVYVFERNEGGPDNWGEVKKLTASDARAGDEFGISVAISGDTIVVGAYVVDVEDFVGSAYVFQRDEGGPGNWGEVKKLSASDPRVNDDYAFSVAVSGDTVMVGAGRHSVNGVVFVYERDEGGANNWGEVKKLTASDGFISHRLGRSLALSGDTAIAGARGDLDGGFNAGAAYVFQRNEGGPGNWGEVKKLVASDPRAFDNFGANVSARGDTAIVSNAPRSTKPGAAYVFGRGEGGAGNWGQVEKLIPSDPDREARFGHSAAVSGGTVFVGAHFHDGEGVQAGAAYVFEVEGPGDTDQDGCTDKAENGPDENLGGMRSDASFWDFYDVWTHTPSDPNGWERNKVINILDIGATSARFGSGPVLSKAEALGQALTPPTSDSGYHPAYDRGPIIGANPWDRGPPDGSINIVDDILGVAQQFGHSCV